MIDKIESVSCNTGEEDMNNIHRGSDETRFSPKTQKNVFSKTKSKCCEHTKEDYIAVGDMILVKTCLSTGEFEPFFCSSDDKEKYS